MGHFILSHPRTTLACPIPAFYHETSNAKYIITFVYLMSSLYTAVVKTKTSYYGATKNWVTFLVITQKGLNNLIFGGLTSLGLGTDPLHMLVQYYEHNIVVFNFEKFCYMTYNY